MPEEMFGRYRLEALIGRGGMGEVFRAIDTDRDRVVALKRLPAALANDPEFQARFRSESALAARLHEPHVIPIHDYGDIDGRLYIDMRLVDGIDLAQHLSDHGAFSPQRAVNVISQVAAALDAAHGEGLVHRDIKPANVLLTTSTGDDSAEGDDFVYVADFGIARAVSGSTGSLTATGATVGSLEYMAPERFTSGGHGDHRVDIYALGCLLYECLTARKPFPGEGFPAMIHGHLNVPPPRASEHQRDLPQGMDAVIATAMAKDPGERYSSAGAMASTARAVLNGTANTAAPMDAQSQLGSFDTFDHSFDPSSHPVAEPLAGETVIRPRNRPPHGKTGLPDDDTPARSSRRPVLWAAAVVMVVALLGGAGSVLLGMANRAEVAQITVEPVGAAGVSPFMPPAGSDQLGLAPPVRPGGVYEGNTPGLYGGNPNTSTCNRDQMAQFLRAHPDEEVAWAQSEGIRPAQVSDHLARLTPVLLRSDTAVTTHSWQNGHAPSQQSVLQAGTAVLVDDHGAPRVRCYSGNPLTPPVRIDQPRYSGQTWVGFSPESVITVQPSPAAIERLTLTNTATAGSFYRTPGSDGQDDRPTDPPPPTVPAVQTSSTSAPAPPARRPTVANPVKRPTVTRCGADQVRTSQGTCKDKPPVDVPKTETEEEEEEEEEDHASKVRKAKERDAAIRNSPDDTGKALPCDRDPVDCEIPRN